MIVMWKQFGDVTILSWSWLNSMKSPFIPCHPSCVLSGRSRKRYAIQQCSHACLYMKYRMNIYFLHIYFPREAGQHWKRLWNLHLWEFSGWSCIWPDVVLMISRGFIMLPPDDPSNVSLRTDKWATGIQWERSSIHSHKLLQLCLRN